jgi:chromosome segregation ATPase
MRFALLDVLTVGRATRAADHEVLPARAAAPPDDGRLQSEALAIMAEEFRRLREQEQSLHRRQAESLESVAEAVSRLADGRNTPPVAAHDPAADALRADLTARDEQLQALRADLAARDNELQTARHTRDRDDAELAAAREELTEARARADRATRRLESTQVKLRRARDELAVEKAPLWRRRRARAALD